jgi:hypothetical protein
MGRPESDENTHEPTLTMPGRPKESGSRQQSLPGQALQSGSPPLDEEATRHAGQVPVPKPST